MWWVSRRIRIERENCCDDLAVSLCGDPVVYAQALADLEELRGSAGHARDGGERRLAAASRSPAARRSVARGPRARLARRRRRRRRDCRDGRHRGRRHGSGGQKSRLKRQSVYSVSRLRRRTADRRSPRARAESAAVRTGSAGREQSTARPLRRGRTIRRSADDVAGGRRSRRHLHASTRALHGMTRALARDVAGCTVGGAGVHARSGRFDRLHRGRRSAGAAPGTAGAAAAREPPLTSRRDRRWLPWRRSRPGADGPSRALEGSDAAHGALAPTAGLAAVLGKQRNSGNFTWSNDGEKLEANYRGEFEFTDDDADVKSMSPDGWLRIRWNGVGGIGPRHTVEFTPDGSGDIERRFWAGSTERPFEPEGRSGSRTSCRDSSDRTGIGASAGRRGSTRRGSAGRARGDRARSKAAGRSGCTFPSCSSMPGLDATTVQQALAQAGREIDSDFELASLLISRRHLLVDDATRKAYMDAARSIESDFEMRRVFASALKDGPLTPAVLAGAPRRQHGIDSDFEQASLLIDFAKLQAIDDATRAPFFNALDTVDSDFEHRRVLPAVLGRRDDFSGDRSVPCSNSAAAHRLRLRERLAAARSARRLTRSKARSARRSSSAESIQLDVRARPRASGRGAAAGCVRARRSLEVIKATAGHGSASRRHRCC